MASLKLERRASAMAACELLRIIFPGRIAFPADANYGSEMELSWSSNCWLPAACFVRPADANGVAQVLRVVKKTGARFAVRGGGQNFNPGFSSVGGYGIVLDLQDLNSLYLENDKTLQVGAGNTWGHVFRFLDQSGLSAAGGRQNNVGVSGFLLGGGMPAFPNLHGLGADNVRNFEVVLSNATIVNANAYENADLYLALKGGGSNFGVVTRFDIATYPIMTETTIATFRLEGYREVLWTVVQAQEAMEKDPKIGMFLTVNPGFIAVGLLYADAILERPHVFESFFKLKSLIQVVVPTTTGTMKSLVNAIGPLTPPTRRLISTVTTKVSYDFYLAVHQFWLDTANHQPGIDSLSYNIQPASPATAQLGKDKGENVLGLEKVTQTWWSFVAEWSDSVNDERASQGLDVLQQGIARLAEEQGQSLDFLSMNAAKYSQDVLGSYGQENVARLSNTAAKYDPEGFFQTHQNDGFLLRKI
ncbi:hypothetical protein F5B22DRAFT_639287 [Xylaria bambusicola]|uniref:uncharacterized protein n=1 Tax=Xylaria bambusicola TaxID=326684 RepID=UPI0020074185|nr:uncharacterized protein F5B22DRAFT_639287 [Xylaria bambusicola]KAI0506263.1 hypothetical protein F5B22DRAFT_639287 [Xylaria bambusicola]